MLGNLVHSYHLQEIYVYDDDPWMGILAEAVFAVRGTYRQTKQKILGQLVLGLDMILSNQSYRELDIYTSVEKNAIRKRHSSRKLHKNIL